MRLKFNLQTAYTHNKNIEYIYIKYLAQFKLS